MWRVSIVIPILEIGRRRQEKLRAEFLDLGAIFKHYNVILFHSVRPPPHKKVERPPDSLKSVGSIDSSEKQATDLLLKYGFWCLRCWNILASKTRRVNVNVLHTTILVSVIQIMLHDCLLALRREAEYL